MHYMFNWLYCNQLIITLLTRCSLLSRFFPDKADNMIRVDSRIADRYIEGEDTGHFRDEWFFSSSSLDIDEGRNIFTPPKGDEDERRDVKRLRDLFSSALSSFTPVNRPLWDALFPSWEEKDLPVDLIVGFPEPYDAVNTLSGDGTTHLVFDLVCWRKYLSFPEIEKNIRNVLTHEFTHCLISYYNPSADAALRSSCYFEKLDGYTFNEGFAHLISYRSTDIDRVDWHSKELEEVFASSKKRMREALSETDREKQKKFLYDAICGRYYEKYACMCGMLYLARVWEKDGGAGLRREFSSFCGFAEKTLG